jgi:hypothetical protein
MSLGAIDMAHQASDFDLTGWVDTPAYDVGGSYEDFHCLIEMEGGIIDTVENASISIDLAQKPKRVLLATRRPIRHLNGFSTVEAKATLWFESDIQRYRLLGNTSTVSYPFKITDNEPSTQTFILKAAKGTYEFKITLTDVRISDIGDAEYVDDIVKVPVTFQALYNATDGTDCMITVKNGESDVVVDSTAITLGLPTDFGPSTIAVQRI